MDAKEFIESRPCIEGPTPSKYNVGDRVRLPEIDNGDEVVPQEEGVVLSYDWNDWGVDSCYMYVIEVDEKYRDEEYDDGLRELDEEQIESKL